MLIIDDDGSAFPHEAAFDALGDRIMSASPGMSIRDYMAAKAMQTILDKAFESIAEDFDVKRVALASYEVADAMLEARSAA